MPDARTASRFGSFFYSLTPFDPGPSPMRQSCACYERCSRAGLALLWVWTMLTILNDNFSQASYLFVDCLHQRLVLTGVCTVDVHDEHVKSNLGPAKL